MNNPFNFTTGYYANTKRATKVHLVDGSHPLCNSKIGADKIYQWCANNVQLDYLECKHCYRIYVDKLTEYLLSIKNTKGKW